MADEGKPVEGNEDESYRAVHSKPPVEPAGEGEAPDRQALRETIAELERSVAERTRELADLAESRRLLFEHAPDALLVVDDVDDELVIRRGNRACTRIFGRPPQRLVGCPLADLIDGTLTLPIDELDGAEHELRLAGGRVVSATCARLPGGSREIVLSLRDVTARCDLAQKLRRTERLAAVGKLAAGVAHEINNPLAVLQLGLEALQQGGLRERDAPERLVQFARHAQRIARIVEGLNELAQAQPSSDQAAALRAAIDAAVAAPGRAASAAAGGSASGADQQARDRSASGLRVLCVEDEPALLSLLTMMLSDLGHRAIEAPSAEAALEILADEEVDAVLTDVQLPGKSGKALEQTIARSHPRLAERVILMSGMFHEARPGQRWLQKPFTFDALASALRLIG